MERRRVRSGLRRGEWCISKSVGTGLKQGSRTVVPINGGVGTGAIRAGHNFAIDMILYQSTNNPDKYHRFGTCLQAKCLQAKRLQAKLERTQVRREQKG